MTVASTLFDLTGKTALVTGASSGLGRRFAQILSQNGAKVILAARRLDELTKFSEEIQNGGGHAFPLEMDVSDRARVQKSIQSLLSQGESIDILINNAGGGKVTPIFEDSDDRDFHDMFHVNVLGVWYVTKIIATHMKEKGIHGSIINIASINGDRYVRSGITGYAASKAAVIQMTKTWVGELSPHHIRINCINPGLFHTPLTNYKLDTPSKRQEMADLIPLGYIPNPEDLDAAILYFASNKASPYVTGSILTVDGGISWGGHTPLEMAK